jgi:hypothetical protein
MLIVTKYHNETDKMTSVFLVTKNVTLFSTLFDVSKHCGFPCPPTVQHLLRLKKNAFRSTEHSTLVTDTTSRDVTELLAVARYSFIIHNYITLTLEVQA